MVLCDAGNHDIGTCYRGDRGPDIEEQDIVLLLAKHNLGAFFAPQKTGLCGAPRFRAPAPSLRAVAAPHPSRSKSAGFATPCAVAPLRGESVPNVPGLRHIAMQISLG
jgi:hypothetical protein